MLERNKLWICDREGSKYWGMRVKGRGKEASRIF